MGDGRTPVRAPQTCREGGGFLHMSGSRRRRSVPARQCQAIRRPSRIGSCGPPQGSIEPGRRGAWFAWSCGVHSVARTSLTADNAAAAARVRPPRWDVPSSIAPVRCQDRSSFTRGRQSQLDQQYAGATPGDERPSPAAGLDHQSGRGGGRLRGTVRERSDTGHARRK
jgi:hypothetical protein